MSVNRSEFGALICLKSTPKVSNGLNRLLGEKGGGAWLRTLLALDPRGRLAARRMLKRLQ